MENHKDLKHMNNQNQQLDQLSKKPKPKWLVPVIVVVGIIILGLAVWAGYELFKPEPIACTLEAKECPDGSYVGRNPELNCEFDPCPEIEDEFANWKTYRNEEYGFEIQYPNDINYLDKYEKENIIHHAALKRIDFNIDDSSAISILIWNKNSILLNYDDSNYEEVIIDNHKAIKGREYGNAYFLETYVFNNAYTYQLEYAGIENEENINLYNQILSTFRFIDKSVCTDSPTHGIGIHYPIDSKYQHLPKLGELFTADDCGIERVNEIYGGEETDYRMGSMIYLTYNPSQFLVSVLKEIGFECADSGNEENCKQWQLEKIVKIKDLLKLKPYFYEFERDDCIHCG